MVEEKKRGSSSFSRSENGDAIKLSDIRDSISKSDRGIDQDFEHGGIQGDHQEFADMLSFANNLKIFLSTEPIDLRKSYEGLYAFTQNRLGEDPLSGGLFLFTNQRYDRIKILYWDGTGLWVMTKRLEKGRFSWPKGTDIQGGKLKLSGEAMVLLLDGVDLRQGKMRPWYQRE